MKIIGCSWALLFLFALCCTIQPMKLANENAKNQPPNSQVSWFSSLSNLFAAMRRTPTVASASGLPNEEPIIVDNDSVSLSHKADKEILQYLKEEEEESVTKLGELLRLLMLKNDTTRITLNAVVVDQARAFLQKKSEKDLEVAQKEYQQSLKIVEQQRSNAMAKVKLVDTLLDILDKFSNPNQQKQ